MPFYDYQCEKCGAYFEVERPMGATGRVKCQSCGSSRTTKVFAPAGVVFKGSGFYVTDSTGKSSATNTSANGSGPSEIAEASTNGKLDTPASKPKPKNESKSKDSE